MHDLDRSRAITAQFWTEVLDNIGRVERAEADVARLTHELALKDALAMGNWRKKEAAEAEVERLKEYEWMYKGLTK